MNPHQFPKVSLYPIFIVGTEDPHVHVHVTAHTTSLSLSLSLRKLFFFLLWPCRLSTPLLPCLPCCSSSWPRSLPARLPAVSPPLWRTRPGAKEARRRQRQIRPTAIFKITLDALAHDCYALSCTTLQPATCDAACILPTPESIKSLHRPERRASGFIDAPPTANLITPPPCGYVAFFACHQPRPTVQRQTPGLPPVSIGSSGCMLTFLVSAHVQTNPV
jgi:hypothetical protein